MLKYIIAAIIFVIITVNITFIYAANKTFSGAVTNDAYNKGLKYNKVVLADAAQKNVVSGSLQLIEGKDGHNVLVFEGSTLFDSATIYFFSTTNSKSDFSIDMPYESKNYLIKLNNDVKGPWLVRIKCYIGETEYYFSEKFNFY